MIEITFPLLVAITMGITEAVKRLMGDVPFTKRVLPFVSITMGICLALGAYEVNFQTVITGIVIGMFACGLFSSGKAVIKG